MTPPLPVPLSVVSVGLESLTDGARAGGIPTLQIDWRPPGSGDPMTAALLTRLAGDRDDDDAPGSRIDHANAEALRRILDAQPRLIGIQAAREVWPTLGRTLFHAGPPIAWERMCGPMRGAVIGAILYEGWARSEDQAVALASRGDVGLAPCHHHGAVGPMAGIVSPSMPVLVVENAAGGTVAHATLNEGLGAVLRFGAYGEAILERLRWIERVLAPGLARAIGGIPGGIDLKAIIARALQMGDEVHNRNVAATSLLHRALAVPLVRSGLAAGAVADILAFVDGNNHFFLNLSMAACKATLDAAHGVPGSSVVTAMARNGVDFGIRVSGLGDRWFTAPAPTPRGLYFSGYSEADANPDLGDSAITETAGLGGFAMAGAPAMVAFVGGTAEDARRATLEMYEITLAPSAAFSLPVLDFRGTPTGIDVRRVVESGLCPVINTGIAHRQPGIGQIGAGIVRAPMACFEAALAALAENV